MHSSCHYFFSFCFLVDLREDIEMGEDSKRVGLSLFDFRVFGRHFGVFRFSFPSFSFLLEWKCKAKFLAVFKYQPAKLKDSQNKQLSIPESSQRPGGLGHEAHTSCPSYLLCSSSYCIAKKDDICLLCSQEIWDALLTLWLVVQDPKIDRYVSKKMKNQHHPHHAFTCLSTFPYPPFLMRIL